MLTSPPRWSRPLLGQDNAPVNVQCPPRRAGTDVGRERPRSGVSVLESTRKLLESSSKGRDGDSPCSVGSEGTERTRRVTCRPPMRQCHSLCRPMDCGCDPRFCIAACETPGARYGWTRGARRWSHPRIARGRTVARVVCYARGVVSPLEARTSHPPGWLLGPRRGWSVGSTGGEGARMMVIFC